MPGILPNVIEKLLAERRQAKASMKKCKPGSLDHEYYNTTQLSVKVLANSIYGFCGTPFAPVFEPFIARAITAVGRNMIESQGTGWKTVSRTQGLFMEVWFIDCRERELAEVFTLQIRTV